MNRKIKEFENKISNEKNLENYNNLKDQIDENLTDRNNEDENNKENEEENKNQKSSD